MMHLLKCLALLVGLSACALATAQTAPTAPPSDNPTNTTGAPLTTDDLSAFFSGLVPFAIHRSDIAGAVVVVVKDGKVLFASGYGFSDLKQHRPVSPDTTLFRPGSTSKLFTWTAVMQLVEQGKLSLDRDVNAYLDFKLPPYHGKPITLRDLMTHTPGFEDSAKDLLPASSADVDLADYLKRHIPARIYPPGEIVAYSNYGCGLAGYIVQRVSGERFEHYLDRHLFAPLDMHHSTFAQPLPASLAPLLASAYTTASDGHAQPFEAVDPAPAGAMTTSAIDMAHFMIAQLNAGRYGENSILQPATVALMHSPQYSPAQGMPGFDLGFYQEDRNGLRIIGHGGDTVLFHSDLHLLLDRNVGIFMSFNSRGNPSDGGVLMVREAIFHAFLDRYFSYPVTARPAVPQATALADAARVAGWYVPSRRNESGLPLLNLASQVHVTASDDGTIAASLLTNEAGIPLRWRETGPLSYQQVDGQDRLRFVTDAQGHIRYWTTDYLPAVEVFERLPAARSLGQAGPLLLLGFLACLLTVVIWMVGALLRSHYRRPWVLPPALRRSRLYSRIGAAILLMDLLGWLVLVGAIGSHTELLLQGRLDAAIYALDFAGCIALLGAIAIVLHLTRVWRSPEYGWLVRIGETCLASAALYLSWFIVAFGLIGFNTHY
ncbi:serine hydrolase domain-containing protein [Frateuria aurantia]